MMLSLGIYLMATYGMINTDYFGYRLLPGTLFIFLMGSLLYEVKHSKSQSTLNSMIPPCVIIVVTGLRMKYSELIKFGGG